MVTDTQESFEDTKIEYNLTVTHLKKKGIFPLGSYVKKICGILNPTGQEYDGMGIMLIKRDESTDTLSLKLSPKGKVTLDLIIEKLQKEDFFVIKKEQN